VKKLLILAVLLSFLLGGCFAALVVISAFVDSSETENCNPETTSGSVSNAALSPSGLTVKGARMTVPQSRNAQKFIRIALGKGLGLEAAVVGIMAAIQESRLINLDYGDRDSVGLLQQRPEMGWGTVEQIMIPDLSILAFYGLAEHTNNPGLTDIVGWQSMSPNDAAQAVQRSGFPDAYAPHEEEARAIVAAYSGGNEGTSSVVNISGNNCSVEDPIEAMVQAALSREGRSVDSIAASEGSFRIVTYNVRGSNHTGHESAMQRAVTQSALIKELRPGVVGLQELRPDQRTRLMELLGDSYDIFPRTEIYGAKQTSANSIIVDTTQFRYVSDRSTPMPYYFHSQELDIPLVELEHLETGLEITVINTHDPAKPIWDRLRYLNAKAHAELVDRLAAQGKTVFFTGDFNSGFKVRIDGNTTYQNERSNLTWCIMTRSGVQINGYDDALGRSGCPMQTTVDLGEGPVDHIYVPRDGVTTTNHTIVREGTASDHPLVYVDIAVDGAEASAEDDEMSSAEFVSWAANEAKLSLPSTIGELNKFEGDLAQGITAEWLGPEVSLQRGDIPLWSTDEDSQPEETGVAFSAAPVNKISGHIVGVKNGRIEKISPRTKKLVGLVRLSSANATVEVVATDGWAPPMKSGTYVKSTTTGGNYGWRIHPIRGTPDFHNGVDLGAVTGADVFSVGPGRIAQIRYDSCWGNLVLVDHGEYYSLYTHLDTFSFGLTLGTVVDAGRQIGVVGNTGECSAGSHLHFSVGTSLEILSGEEAGSVNPVNFLLERGIVL
jgi:murein DD-endopeptidase MepM/ murein hydrolase activator NlpD